MIGGILEFAGVAGFTENANILAEASEEEDAESLTLVDNLHLYYESRPFTTGARARCQAAKAM